MLNKLCVLELNKNWFPITIKTPYVVFKNFCTGNLLGLDMEFSDEDIENHNYEHPTKLVPVDWDDWVNLPIRDYDMVINTPRTQIRVPNIVICSTYNKIPDKSPKLSKRNVMLRDKMTCQFTGRQYPPSELNIDHIIPRSKGGKNTWENLVTCYKAINTRKGDKTLKESGLKLIRQPKQPTISNIFFAGKVKDPRWGIFLKQLN